MISLAAPRRRSARARVYRLIGAVLLSSTLFAQTTDPLVLVQQIVTDAQVLQSQLATANATIAALQAQLAGGPTPQNTADAAFGATVRTSCDNCQAVILNAIGAQTGLTSNMLCCGPTTVPPTPADLPPGYVLIVIEPLASSSGGIAPH